MIGIFAEEGAGILVGNTEIAHPRAAAVTVVKMVRSIYPLVRENKL